MNVFSREMKAHRKSFIIWSVGVLFLVISGMAKFAGLASSGQSMNELLASMPKSLQAILGTGTFDISTASGYFGVLYIYLVLMTSIHATMLGATIISKEERDKTAEFLFVKPVSRNKVVSSKLLAALVNSIMLTIITGISSYYLVGKYSEGESVGATIMIAMVGMFILQLLFLVIGSALAAVSKNAKLAVSLSTGILLVAYIVSIAVDLNEKLAFLKYFTPFKYFEAKNTMFGGGFDSLFLLLSFVLIMLFSLVTYVFYNKRDLRM